MPTSKRELLALAFAMIWPTLMALFVFLRPAEETGASNPLLQLSYYCGKVVQFGFPLFWLWVVERTRPRLSRPTWGGLKFGLGFGLGIAAAILLLYFGLLKDSWLMADTPEQVRARVERFGLDTPGRFILFGFFLCVLHSLLEEYYWRWFVFGRLRGWLPLWPAVAVSSLAFMSHHVVVLGPLFPGRFWTAVVPFSLCVAGGGAVWAWLYDRTGSLYSPWLSHLLIDAAIFFGVGYDMLF